MQLYCGKSASDSALIIDAMDILYSGKVSGFCLVSSDSDFTKLAMRLKEAGMMVIGMGEEKTPKSFVNACENFKYLDLLYNKEEAEENSAQPPQEEIRMHLRKRMPGTMTTFRSFRILKRR